MKYSLPKSIFYLILNEITERYSLYGMRSILISFMITHIYLSEQDSLSIFHAFIVIGYFFSIFGGIIGDRYSDKKYYLLVFLSIIYTIGHIVLSYAVNIKDMYFGLSIIAFCTGLIKPIIVSFIGDQFELPDQQNKYGIAMNLLFLAVNIGSTLSMVLAPYLLHHYGPTIAFIVPAFAMIFSLLFFIAGKKYYIIKPKIIPNINNINQKFTRGKIITVIFIFILLSIFFTLFDQMFSVVVLQAKLMDCNIFGFNILPSQVPTVNPILIIIISPLFNYIYKYLDKNGYKIHIFTKIKIGMIIASFAFIILLSIQYFIDKGDLINIKWQFLAFIFITIAEVLIMPSSAEFAYSVAPNWAKCKSISFFFLSISVGNIISMIIINNCIDKYMIFTVSVFLGMFSCVCLFSIFGFYNKNY